MDEDRKIQELDEEEFDENEAERLQELITAISNNPKYDGCVFEADVIYFVVDGDEILEISSDAGYSPKGSWFPRIVAGPSIEEHECMNALMSKLGFRNDFFEEILKYDDEVSDETMLEYFEEQEDKEAAEIYEKIKEEIGGGKTLFNSVSDFADALHRYDLEAGHLYYIFFDDRENCFIDFYDNICCVGEPMGEFEYFSESDWIDILENIDKHIVQPDP